MNGIDITGQRFGRLTAIRLIPREERTWSNKERAWLCKCDCGNECIVRQRSLLCTRMTRSCGCLRKIDAFLATTNIQGLTEEYLLSFDNFEKFLFIHRSIIQNINLVNIEKDKYKDYIEYFYFQTNFNKIYNFWLNQKRGSTFYDLAKPSIDHIIPKSRGGSNKLSNLQFLTVFENLAKRDMTMAEWNQFKKATNTQSTYFIEEILKGGDTNE